MSKLIFTVTFLQVLPVALGWSRETTRRVLDEPLPVVEIVQECTFCRYNDPHFNLTCLKDTKYAACFISDLDPLWKLTERDKQDIIDNQPCEKVSEADLTRKAGAVIADMCSKYHIFWLTSAQTVPSLREGSNKPQQSSCKLRRALNSPGYKENVESLKSNVAGFDDSTPNPLPDPVNPSDIVFNQVKPLVSGDSFTQRTLIRSQQDTSTDGQPATDSNGFFIPPMIHSMKDPEGRNADSESNGPFAENFVNKGTDLIAPPLMSNGEELSEAQEKRENIDAPPLVYENKNNDLPPIPIVSNKPPLVQRIESSKNDSPAQPPQPYPVPKMGSMNAPPLPLALRRMLNNNSNMVNSKATVAPPTPDMRTPALPKGVHLPLK